MGKRLYIPLLMAIISLLVAVPVLAAYYVDIDVTESNGTSYDMLTMKVTMDIDYLAEHGFISDTGLDVRIEDSQSNEAPFMLAVDRMIFASDITGDMVNSFQMTTGNTPLDNFSICVGDGGYIAITDHANLELGNDFEIELDGYIDTTQPSYPILEASATSAEDTKVEDHDVSLPSGIEVGDLLILLFSCRDPAGTACAITWPDGWTELDKYTTSGYGRGVCYKIASGTESGTVVVVTTNPYYSAHQTFRIVDYQGTPEISVSASGNNQYPDSDSLTPTWQDDENTLWLTWFGAYSVADRTMVSYPTNYSNGQFTKTTGCYACVGSAFREYCVTSEDPSQFELDNTVNWHAWIIGIQGYNSIVIKPAAFEVYISNESEISARMLSSTPKIVTATNLDADEYIVIAGADTTNLYIKIDGDTKDSEALAGQSVPDNSNDWQLYPIYFIYYKHTTSDTLRLTYEPDSIILGTTLPNEENPGTYDGTITWGSNPAGIGIATSGLQLEEIYYFEDVEGVSQDIFEPEPAELISGVDLERLENNPMHPLVSGIVDASDGKLTTSLVWILGAWFITIAAYIAVFILMREHIIFAGLAGEGLAILFYAMGIFDYWVLILFAFGIIAGIVQERTPTW